MRKIKALRSFLGQLEKLDKPSRELIHNKIELIKQNPYRFKRLHSNQYSKVFRVRFSLNKQDTRLVYVVIEPDIVLVCLLDRGKENFAKWLKVL